MRQERLYTLVGLFVGGAVCLTVLTALFFYDEYAREKVETYVMFFKGSLTGLDITSAVTYRGVKIGEVKLIEVTEDEENNIKIPVYTQFFVEKKYGIKHNPIQQLINKGFVANIKNPNFLTGIASIELIPSTTPIEFQQQSYHGYPVFPTNAQSENPMSFQETLQTAKQAFQDISDFFRAPKINETINAMKTMADSFEHLASNLGQQIPPTLTAFNVSLKNFDRLANNLNHEMPPMLIKFSDSLKGFEHLTHDLNEQVPPMIAAVNQGFKQVSSAANATQNLADYLSRYPESLLRGKK
ncbi:MlaD family protein [Legionella fairfieldensis]|uniref:MlaD family protein n=1 Tax=Legionella fairfieldensis TaxID=45064 RepID=UPI00048E91AE|nr:MlaD family protein [Legionella fairfieldensis]